MGKNESGVKANRTPYITLLVKIYAELHPRRAFEVRAVVEARINTPVRTELSDIIRGADLDKEYSNARVEIESVPRRPRNGSSTMYPARSAPGAPMTLKITCWGGFNVRCHSK